MSGVLAHPFSHGTELGLQCACFASKIWLSDVASSIENSFLGIYSKNPFGFFFLIGRGTGTYPGNKK